MKKTRSATPSSSVRATKLSKSGPSPTRVRVAGVRIVGVGNGGDGIVVFRRRRPIGDRAKIGGVEHIVVEKKGFDAGDDGNAAPAFNPETAARAGDFERSGDVVEFEAVRPRSAIDRINARPVSESVFARPAVERVIAAAAAENVVVGAAEKRVGAAPADERVVAVASRKPIASAADQKIIAAGPVDFMSRGGPRERVSVVGAGDVFDPGDSDGEACGDVLPTGAIKGEINADGAFGE